jgi:hypothetical protein
VCVAIRVRQAGEIGLPQHRDQVVVVDRGFLRPADDVEEPHDFRILDAFGEAQFADAVLVEQPGEAVRGFHRVGEHREAGPLQIRFGDAEGQFIAGDPDVGEPVPQRVERAFVHRIVRRVELLRADRLDDEPHEFFDCRISIR